MCLPIFYCLYLVSYAYCYCVGFIPKHHRTVVQRSARMTCILVNCMYELFTLHEQCASKIKLDDIVNVIPV